MTHAIAHPANQLFLNNNMQNANTPDVDLDRDLIVTWGEEMGKEAAEREKRDPNFRINVATIAISAFIFLIILAWFDFIQTAFYVYLDPDSEESMIPSDIELWYALLLTGLSVILIILIMYYSGIRF